MRLEGKVAIVMGAGQTPGSTVGNGRACALLFAREGARVLAVDKDPASAEETAQLIHDEGGESVAFEADVTNEASVEAAIGECVRRWDRLDVLHNNVGISVTGGDASGTEITTEAFDRIMAVNLRGTVMACKHALPVMREQGIGGDSSRNPPESSRFEGPLWSAYPGCDHCSYRNPARSRPDNHQLPALEAPRGYRCRLPWRSSRIDRRCRNTHATPFRGSRPSTSMVMYAGVSPTVSRMVSQY